MDENKNNLPNGPYSQDNGSGNTAGEVHTTSTQTTIGEKRKKQKKEKKPRKKHYVLRFIGALFRFLLTLLLGMAIAYGSIAFALYYAVSGLTLDVLQQFGIGEGAEEYLSDQGEVDLTEISLLELIADLNSVRADLGNQTLQSMIDRYGIVLPEETKAKLPTDLFSIPLDVLLSSEAGNVVAEHLKFGYILSFLPENTLGEKAMEVLSERPLSLLTTGKYGELFAGLKLGYLTGVTFDENGVMQPKDPSVLTLQEALGDLDMGKVLTALTQNGDLLGVMATDLGNNEIAPILGGIMSGALLEKMCEGRLLKDVLLQDATSGRYTFSLTALATDVYLGDALGYTLVDDVWYSAYTDNGDDTDDVKASKMNATLADISLADVIGGTLSVEESFDGLYFGDLQNGYVRGDAITEPNPEPEGEPVIVGYHWFKDDKEVGKMQSELANISVNDVLNGKLDINATLGDLYFGDLQGYERRDVLEGDVIVDHKWVKVEADGTETEISAVLSAMADVVLSDVLNGKLDVSAALGDLTVGDVQGYIRGEDERWYREIKVEGEEPTLKYVGAVQNSISDIKLSDILNGEFDLAKSLEGVRMGEAMNYERGEITTPADPNKEGSYDVYAFTKADGTAVTGPMLEIANLPISDVINGTVDFEDTVKDMTIAEVLEYTLHDGVWYSEYSDDGDDTNDVPVKGILAVLAEKKINELNTATINAIALGEVLGYTHKDTDEDGEPDTWYDGEEVAEGIMGKFAGLTIGQLSDDDMVSDKLRELTLADAMNYTKVGDAWYSVYSDDGDDTNDVKVTGILAVLAEKQLNELSAATIEDITLAEALGYTYGDSDNDGVADAWYSGEEKVTGVMASMADLTIAELKNPSAVTDKLGDVKLAAVLGYTKNEADGAWYRDSDNHKASGVMAHLMDITVDGVEHEIDEMPLGYAFGFYRNENTGEWFTDAEMTQKPTGVTAALADIHLTHAREEFDEMKIGTLLGYDHVDTDADGEKDTWQHNGAPLESLDLVFADMPVADLGDSDKIAAAMQKAKLGDSLGFKKVGNTWYKTEIVGEEPQDVPVTGFMAALADSPIGSIETDVQTVLIGDMMSFTKIGGKWYDADDQEVTGVLAVLADSNLDTLSSDIEEITIGDLYSESEREGILKAIPADTKINELNTAIEDCTVQDLISCGVLTVSSTQAGVLDMTLSGWRDYSLVDFLQYLLNKAVPG
ncbi:MAG: hypothetical protein IJW51_00565 [Clostridia bacterium]|nr:hypothetical protein [Clostridia bacterium]